MLASMLQETPNKLKTIVTTMRTTLSIVVLALGTLAHAQNSAVVSAYMAMEDNKLAEAAGYIEPAILNEGTMVKEKTWRYRGQIYQRIAMSDDAALKAQFPDALDKAIASYQKANELDTKGAEKAENNKQLRMMQAVALNAGNDAFTAKDYDKAVSCYAKSEAIAKGFGEIDSNAVFNSALAYESKGDQAMALERYKECLRIGYDKVDIYRYTASLQKRAGDLEGAIATTKDGLGRHANHKELMLDLIAFLQEAGRVTEVEGMVGKALEQDPGNAVLYSLRASIFEGKADPKSGAKPTDADMVKWYDMAEMDYKKSIELDPKFFDSYFNIGVLYNNRAAAAYEKCNTLKDDAAYTKCKKAADDIYVKAVPYFEQAHALKADDRPTIQQLKVLYAKAGNTAKFDEMKKLLGE